MRIALLNMYYYPQIIGGAEISVQKLAETLAKDNEVFVIFISNDANKVNYAVITTALISDGLAAVWVPAEVTVSDREN